MDNEDVLNLNSATEDMRICEVNYLNGILFLARRVSSDSYSSSIPVKIPNQIIGGKDGDWSPGRKLQPEYGMETVGKIHEVRRGLPLAGYSVI